VCVPEHRVMFIYGGCYGYNTILDDHYEYNIEKCRFTKLSKPSDCAYPDARAWHSATRVGNFIYYFGGVKNNSSFANDVLSFDIRKLEWNAIVLSSSVNIPSPRCSHAGIGIESSLLIFGGMGISESEDDAKTSYSFNKSSEPRKLDLESIYILETNDEKDLENFLTKMSYDTDEFLESIDDEQNAPNKSKLIIPPPIPFYLKDSRKLLEEQANFFHWNPHIFPCEANKQKIQYFKKKIEENSFNPNILNEFEGLGEDEMHFSTSSSFKK